MSNVITKEFQGNVFQFREDGYFNMTAAAKAFDKRLDNFFRSPDTQAYLDEFEVFFKSNYLNLSNLKPVEIARGRYGGTWGHPKVAVLFARWLDPKFSLWCDMVIDDILNKKMEVKVVKPEQSMAMRVPKSFPEALRLAAKMAERNEKLESKLAVAEKELNLVTVDEYRALTHRYMPHGQKVRLGRKAAEIMREMGMTVEKQERVLGERICSVNVYPRHILEKAEQRLASN